jgi:putative ABC transport system permease protein
MLIKIAFRNIFRNRRRSAITLLVIVFGSVGLILFGGYKAHTFYALRESTIRSRLGHLQIYRKGYATAESQKPLAYALDDVAAVRAVVERDPRVKMTAAQITLMGLVSNGEKSETFIAVAVEPEKEKLMQSQRITSGSNLPVNEPDAAMLGAGLAKSMHVKPGDYVTLMTTTVAGSLNAMDVRVAGIFITGVKEYDERAVKMPISGAQMLMQTKKVERLLVFLKDTDDTSAVHASLATKLPAVEFKEWKELASFYNQVVALYNGIFGFLGFIVFAIVIFSVANTIMMSIFERTREIGTLMAIGTTRSRLWRMFLTEGFAIGVIGGALGVAAGVAIANFINHGNVMLPPPPGYTVGYRLQIMMQPGVLLPAAIISVVTATLSSIVPAFKASRMKIVDALGHI